MPAPTPPADPIPVPAPPDRTDKSTFISRSFVFTNWYIPFQAWLVTVVTYITDAITWVTGLVSQAEASATSAALSADAAANLSDFKGSWSSLTGALNKPATVLHNGAYWALLNNLADVTTSTPGVSNTDWAFANGTRWLTPYTASATLIPNSQSTIIATSAAADMTLPAMATNDFIVLHNSPVSTQTVRMINASYTIRGSKGTISAGDNLIIRPGEVVHLKAISSSILEVV